MYAWKPNRDAGCVRRHTRPSTHRRMPGRYCDSIPSRIAQDERRQVRQFVRSHAADLAAGASLSIARPRDGWDEGDKISGNIVVLA